MTSSSHAMPFIEKWQASVEQPRTAAQPPQHRTSNARGERGISFALEVVAVASPGHARPALAMSRDPSAECGLRPERSSVYLWGRGDATHGRGRRAGPRATLNRHRPTRRRDQTTQKSILADVLRNTAGERMLGNECRR
jgi:hypothetical protein